MIKLKKLKKSSTDNVENTENKSKALQQVINNERHKQNLGTTQP